MRRHSETWLIKILLGLIALSFVAFFGYSTITSQQLGAQTAAQVGDRAIPLQQFTASYNAAVSRIQDQFPDGIPDDFDKFLRANILEQLIQREVKTSFALSLRFYITDAEVARAIRKQDQFYRDGVFDMQFYKSELRRIRSDFGINFEEVLREDMLLDLYDTFQLIGLLSSPEETNWQADAAKNRWEFKVIEVPIETARQAFPDDAEAETKVQTQLKAWIAQWQKGPLPKKELKKFAAKERDKTTISFLERDQLLGRRLPDEHASTLLRLKEANTVYPEPIRLGNSWYLLKLQQRTTAEAETSEPLAQRLYDEFFNSWLNDYRNELKITRNISL